MCMHERQRQKRMNKKDKFLPSDDDDISSKFCDHLRRDLYKTRDFLVSLVRSM